jgi:branched-subunit amino acid ABC-type transport system permease component
MYSQGRTMSMNRRALVRIHRWAAAGALGMIGAFLTSSLVTELAGDPAERADLRLAIVLALPALVACLAAAGLTGRRLAGRSRARAIRRKQRRMQIIAAIGLAVLVPCAIILYLATASSWAEITELLAGVVNFSLLMLNFRDGRRMTRRHPAVARHRPAPDVVNTGA